MYLQSNNNNNNSKSKRWATSTTTTPTRLSYIKHASKLRNKGSSSFRTNSPSSSAPVRLAESSANDSPVHHSFTHSSASVVSTVANSQVETSIERPSFIIRSRDQQPEDKVCCQWQFLERRTPNLKTSATNLKAILSEVLSFRYKYMYVYIFIYIYIYVRVWDWWAMSSLCGPKYVYNATGGK